MTQSPTGGIRSCSVATQTSPKGQQTNKQTTNKQNNNKQTTNKQQQTIKNYQKN